MYDLGSAVAETVTGGSILWTSVLALAPPAFWKRSISIQPVSYIDSKMELAHALVTGTMAAAAVALDCSQTEPGSGASRRSVMFGLTSKQA